MKIAIGNDHAGVELKFELEKWLREQGHNTQNFGTDTTDSMDYPDVVHPLVSAVEEGSFDLGILVCGSGQGVSITANKHKAARAALCWQPEIAELARAHNNANLLCLPGRFLDKNTALEILKRFLDTPFEAGRHQVRVDKIPLP